MEKKNVVDELLWEYIWFGDVSDLLKIGIKNLLLTLWNS